MAERACEPRWKTAELHARVLGPAPAPIAKLRGNYRFQIQIQGPDGDRLAPPSARPPPSSKPPDDVQWIVDVDPVDML